MGASRRRRRRNARGGNQSAQRPGQQEPAPQQRDFVPQQRRKDGHHRRRGGRPAGSPPQPRWSSGSIPSGARRRPRRPTTTAAGPNRSRRASSDKVPRERPRSAARIPFGRVEPQRYRPVIDQGDLHLPPEAAGRHGHPALAQPGDKFLVQQAPPVPAAPRRCSSAGALCGHRPRA